MKYLESIRVSLRDLKRKSSQAAILKKNNPTTSYLTVAIF